MIMTEWKILSASWSKRSPSLDAIFNRLAIYPSKKSEHAHQIEITNNTKAEGLIKTENANTIREIVTRLRIALLLESLVGICF